MTRIKTIVWNEWNIEHIKKHGVSVSEAEEAAKSFVFHYRTQKGRYLVSGRSGKRILTLIIGRRQTTTYYLVTARDASKKERTKLYEKELKRS